MYDVELFMPQMHSSGVARHTNESVVPSTVRAYLDAVVAVATMAVIAVVCGFIAALITTGTAPKLLVTAVAFLLTGALLFLRLWLKSRTVAPPI